MHECLAYVWFLEQKQNQRKKITGLIHAGEPGSVIRQDAGTGEGQRAGEMEQAGLNNFWTTNKNS